MATIFCYENINIYLAFIISLYITSSFWTIMKTIYLINLPEEKLIKENVGWVPIGYIFIEILGIVISFLFFNLNWFWEMLIGLLFNLAMIVIIILLCLMITTIKPKEKVKEDFSNKDQDSNDNEI